MTAPQIDLYSISEVYAWEKQKRLEGWTNQQFFDWYRGLNSDIADFRSLSYSAVRGLEKYQFDEALTANLVKTSNNPLLRLIAQTIYTWRLGYRLGNVQETRSQFAEITRALDSYLLQVRNHPEGGEFRIEAEFQVLKFIVLRDSMIDPTAAVAASQVMLTVASLLTPFHVGYAYSAYSSSLVHKSRWKDAHEVFQENRPLIKEAGLDETHTAVLSRIYCHMNLLNLAAALAELEAAQTTFDVEAREIHLNNLKLFYGLGGENFDYEAVRESFGDTVHISVSLQLIMEVHKLIPTKQNLPRRKQFLYEAIRVVQNRQTPISPPDVAYEQWLKAYLYLKNGNYALSNHYLRAIEPVEEQDLYTRSLIAGLKLELASYAGSYEVEPVEVTVRELEAIYTYALNISPANRDGYLQLLSRWFPIAGAMLRYVVTDPDTEALKNAVIAFNNQNMCHGISLPAPFCLEIYLKEVFQNEETVSSPRLNGKMTPDRDRLMTEYENFTYFRQPITAFKLAYLLLKSNLPSRSILLQLALEEFGLPQKTRSSYEDTLVEKATKLVSQLINREIDLKTFDHRILSVH